jgi:hypothetical protein
LHTVCLVGGPFNPKIDAHKAAHRYRVVQRFLNRRIRQVEPQLQEVEIRSIRSSAIGGHPPFSLIVGYTVSTAAVISGHGIIRSMSARNCARRVLSTAASLAANCAEL